ncbi:MAG: SUMF1/EgtB/PvdO family nonheme iron enzyme [Deltaproteobacteria bacterium]|nr:SUMF1/EgtB/PvdO family nonheme iron enzyme [Deltaproteobacteria bacterium]
MTRRPAIRRSIVLPIAAVGAAALAVLCGCQKVFDVPAASPMLMYNLRLDSDQSYDFVTKDLVPEVEGAEPDTVMHIVNTWTKEWISSNDECADLPGVDSCIRNFTPPSPGLYTVIVHAFTTESASSGTMMVTTSDGTTLREVRGQRFGGVSFKTPDYYLGWHAGEELFSVSAPGGPLVTTCVVPYYPAGYTARNDVRLLAWDRRSWIGKGCNAILPEPSYALGRPLWLVVGVQQGENDGHGTLYMNDGWNDNDGDGLGAYLETQLGLCDRDPGGPGGDATPCGPDMAMIETLGVCIDRYEAARAPDGHAISIPGVIPWTGIAWEWAGGACRLAGKRLCTSDEWGAACGGPDDLSYPWGNEPSSGRCANEALADLQPTGAFPECEGWYPGVFDMIGSVSEWTSTWKDPVGGPTGYITRGGTIHGNDGDVCYSTSETMPSELGDPHLGFRCCRDPE